MDVLVVILVQMNVFRCTMPHWQVERVTRYFMPLLSAPTRTRIRTDLHQSTDRPQDRRWLLLARVVWIVVAVCIVVLIVKGTPAEFHSLQTTCLGAGCSNTPQFSPQQLQ